MLILNWALVSTQAENAIHWLLDRLCFLVLVASGILILESVASMAYFATSLGNHCGKIQTGSQGSHCYYVWFLQTSTSGVHKELHGLQCKLLQWMFQNTPSLGNRESPAWICRTNHQLQTQGKYTVPYRIWVAAFSCSFRPICAMVVAFWDHYCFIDYCCYLLSEPQAFFLADGQVVVIEGDSEKIIEGYCKNKVFYFVEYIVLLVIWVSFFFFLAFFFCFF